MKAFGPIHPVCTLSGRPCAGFRTKTTENRGLADFAVFRQGESDAFGGMKGLQLRKKIVTQRITAMAGRRNANYAEDSNNGNPGLGQLCFGVIWPRPAGKLVRSLKSAPASAVQNFIFSISYFQAARLLGRDVTSATRQRTSLA